MGNSSSLPILCSTPFRERIGSNSSLPRQSNPQPAHSEMRFAVSTFALGWGLTALPIKPMYPGFMPAEGRAQTAESDVLYLAAGFQQSG